MNRSTSPPAPRWLERRPRSWGRGGLLLAAILAAAPACEESSNTGVTPDYSITLEPAILTIVAGAAGNSTVTLARTDFDGEVTFSVSGNPAGVSGSFSPPATTGDNSTLTVGVSSSTTPGDYIISVRGAATAGNRSRGLAITVSPPLPNFELSVAPSAVTIAQGATGTTGVTLTRTDFTGAVALALIDAPAGITGSFDPAAPTGNGSVLTLTIGAAVPPSIYEVTVEGTGTPGSRTAGFFLTVTP